MGLVSDESAKYTDATLPFDSGAGDTQYSVPAKSIIAVLVHDRDLSWRKGATYIIPRLIICNNSKESQANTISSTLYNILIHPVMKPESSAFWPQLRVLLAAI